MTGDFRTSRFLVETEDSTEEKCVRVRISRKGARDYDKQDEETYRSFVVASDGNGEDDGKRGEGREEK